MSRDERRGPGHPFPERRHNVRTRLAMPGIALASMAVIVIVYQLGLLVLG